MSTLVKTFMHQPVACLALPGNVGTARDLMKQKNCHALPLVDVIEEDQVQVRGIVTSTDCRSAHARARHSPFVGHGK